MAENIESLYVPVGGKVAKRDDVAIVLIGCDCSGKTTLAEMLREHYGIEKVANRRLPGDLAMIMAVTEFTLERMPQKAFILDQWQYPVDIVYRYILEQAISPLGSVESLLLPYLNAHNVLFIHLTADETTITERFNVRGDELWDLGQILRVRRGYIQYLQTAEFKHVTIDTSDLTPQEVFERAVELINYNQGSEVR